MKIIALLFALYTVIISGILVGIGWIAGFVLIPFQAGFEKGHDHHQELMAYLKKKL